MAAYTTIDDPSAYFQVAQWTGNASTRSITLPGDTDMQPDIVWVKGRSVDHSHRFYDSVRGATKYLNTATDGAEGSGADTMQAFQSDGFQVGTDGSHNTNTDTYVAWCWKESATAGFDIVAFEGTGSARTISHSLSAVPHLLITKQREDPGGGSNSWNVYHHKNTSAQETDYLTLNGNSATSDSNIRWNDTAPTSSVFTVGTGNSVNQSGVDHIMYLWSEKQGYSKFGSYVGNGSSSGPMIWLGFRPAWVMFKKTDSGTADWEIMDNKRAGYNDATYKISANATSAENTDSGRLEILSNGFKIRTTGTGLNTSGGTYIYVAFAEAPFVNSNGVPCNAR